MERRILYRNGALADGRGARLRYGVSILVEDGRIAWIRPADGEEDPGPRAGFELVDARGATFVPGMVDGHSHITLPGGANWLDRIVEPPERLLEVAEQNAELALRAGVRWFRDVGSPTAEDPVDGQARAERLHAAAVDTIAVPELQPEMAFEVGLLLDQYDLLERQIAAADAHVATLLDGELARRLQTIPGVGPATAATLIAEIGDIERFDTFDQLLAYAGIHPAERSSGRKGANPETAWRMSKAGNAYLRTAVYRMAVVGITHNPVIGAHYERKRAAGKSKMNAVGHCMRKALSLVWGVWRNGQDFDPEWAARA